MNLEHLASQLVAVGLDVAGKATVLLVLTCAVISLCRRSSAAIRHSIWRVAMLGLLALPLATWALPAWRLPILPAGYAGTTVDVQTAENRASVESAQSAIPGVTTGSRSSATGNGVEPAGRVNLALAEANAAPLPVTTSIEGAPEQLQSAAAQRQPAPVPSTRWTLVIGALWGGGALIWALVFVRGLWRTAKLRWQSVALCDPSLTVAVRELGQRLVLRRKVGLREHPQPVIPLTWGVLRPVILLPQVARQWSRAMRHAVLLHELAHVQRGDVLAQLVARMACVLHWYHPLAWYALRKMRHEREQACDDAVVHAGEKASDYAEQLVEVARLCVAPGGLSLAIAMAEGNSLERRLRSLFDLSRGHGPVRRTVVLVLLLLGALIVGTLSSIEPVAATADATESPAILTGEAARERLMQVRPQLTTSSHGLQFAVSYAPEKIAFVAGERVPVDLYLRNGGTEAIWLSFLLLDANFPPLLLNEQGDSVPLTVEHERFAHQPVVVALRPGDVCVIQRSVGVGAGQHAPALETLTRGQYHLRYDLPVTALDRTGTELWKDQLVAQPLAWEVVETVPQTPFVRTPGVPRSGYVSPEVLELLAPRFGAAHRNIQLGVAVNSLKKSFAVGTPIPLTLLYRNVGDQTVTFDTHLDFVADPPVVTNDRGEPSEVSFIIHFMFVGPTTVTLEPGQTWAINTPGLGLGSGGSVIALEDPAPGKYRLTYEEGIFEKLGLPASTPIWSEHLTTGPLELEITPAADGSLQAVLVNTASSQPMHVHAAPADDHYQAVEPTSWIPARPVEAAVSSGGTTKLLEDYSVRLEGDVSWQEVHLQFEFDKPTNVEEIRLELLSVDSPTGPQFGRGGEELMLFDVKPSIEGQTGKSTSIDFASCTYLQNPSDETTANCIDQLSDTGWKAPKLPADATAHELVLRFEKPITLRADQRLTLAVDSGGAKELAVLNRIRFAFRQGAYAEAMTPNKPNQPASPTADDVTTKQHNDAAKGDRLETGKVVLHAIDADTGEPIRDVVFVKENAVGEIWAKAVGSSDADGMVHIDLKPLPGYFFSILPVPEGYKVTSLDEVPAQVKVGSRVDYRFYLRKLGTNLDVVKEVPEPKSAGNRFADTLKDSNKDRFQIVIDDMPGFRGKSVTFSFARENSLLAERIFANGELVRAAVDDELRYFQKAEGKLAGNSSELSDIKIVISNTTLPRAPKTSWHLYCRTKDSIELRQDGFKFRFEGLDHWDLEIPAFLHPEF